MSLHGVTFGLVDGVLALHLHSALSAMGKKILEKRKFNRIARDLDLLFEDATELEMNKNNDDVCCICLGSMSIDGSPVKKVSCGHMYHTTCLREVVERARTIEAAKCPLCRASVLNGTHTPPTTTSNTTPTPLTNNIPMDNATVAATGTNNNRNEEPVDDARPPAVGDHALFRFSTEGILPAWIPIPAFSFEVVRRPPTTLTTPINNTTNAATTTNDETDNNDDAPPNTEQDDNDNANNNNIMATQTNNNGINEDANNEEPEENVSLWRRFFILSGIMPMSPQEEANALAQLVDMFPQYERADLLLELRERRSTEAVVEAVLMGVFTSGLPRQGALVVDRPTTNTNTTSNDATTTPTNASITDTNSDNNNNLQEPETTSTTTSNNNTSNEHSMNIGLSSSYSDVPTDNQHSTTHN